MAMCTVTALLTGGDLRAECGESVRMPLPDCVEIVDGGEGEKSVTVQNNCLKDVMIKVDRKRLGDWEFELGYSDSGEDDGRAVIRAIRCCGDYTDNPDGGSGCDEAGYEDALVECEDRFNESPASKTGFLPTFTVVDKLCRVRVACPAGKSGGYWRTADVDFDEAAQLSCCEGGVLRVGGC